VLILYAIILLAHRVWQARKARPALLVLILRLALYG